LILIKSFFLSFFVLCRRFVLEDLKLLVEQSTASDMNFQSSLFKMQTDQLGFERFEELFEKEDEDVPEEPSYDSEWRRCEVSNLMMDFMDFVCITLFNFRNDFCIPSSLPFLSSLQM
jgi:hypothetical protein